MSGPLFNKNYLTVFKNTALVNVARGEHIDEAGIINALERDNLAAYFADVLPPKVEFHKDVSMSPLWTAYTQGRFKNRLTLTPHIGNTSEEFEKSCNELINSIVRRIYMSETMFIDGKSIDLS